MDRDRDRLQKKISRLIQELGETMLELTKFNLPNPTYEAHAFLQSEADWERYKKWLDTQKTFSESKLIVENEPRGYPCLAIVAGSDIGTNYTTGQDQEEFEIDFLDIHSLAFIPEG